MKPCCTKLCSIACSFCMCILAAMQVGCAGSRAYKEGNALLAEGKTEQGLEKLEEAVKLDPKNAEYRISLFSYRATIINRLISQGEMARREGRLSDAEKIYRRIQVFDAENAIAKQGLDALTQARRHKLIIADAETLLKKGTEADLSDALEKLRPILSENPNQQDAFNLKSRIEELLYREQKAELKLAKIFRKPISLEFRDAPLKSVIEVIAKVSGLSFFYDKDIRPDLKTTVFAKNTTIEDAMRLLLVTNQLEYKVLNENSILIYPNTPQKLKEYQTLAVRSFFLSNADVKGVSNSIKTIVKTKDMVVDERLGIIILRDTPDAIRLAERIVALQDLSDPEVMLEVEIMEIKRSRLLELGIQWPSQLTLTPLQISGVPLTLDDLRHLTAATTQVAVGNVLVNANKADQDSNILANPRIRVKNKEKAKIQIGDRVPVITTTSTSTGFVSESVSYVDVGLKLEVEPNIYLNDEVSIKVNLEVSSLVREILSKSGTLSYQIGSRGATTVLRLKNGETQILAGLISDEDRSTANKVPGLGEMPLAGRLFGSQKDDTQRSEILLSITPRIVRAIKRPDMLAAEFESGTESSIGAKSLRLSTVAPIDKSNEKNKNDSIHTGASAADARQQKHDGSNINKSGGVTNGTVSAIKDATGGVGFSWQAPTQVKVGEQFSLALQVDSQHPLRGLPVLIGFDPQILQISNVQEGDFFKQGNSQTNFSQRVDPGQGKIYVALMRQNGTGGDAGINGKGSLITLTFKALKATAAAKVQLLSATPEPQAKIPVILPVEKTLRVIP